MREMKYAGVRDRERERELACCVVLTQRARRCNHDFSSFADLPRTDSNETHSHE